MADSAPQTSAAPPPAENPGRTANGKRKLLLARLALIFVLAGAGYAVYWFLVGRYEAGTDDAYVAGNVVQVAPQISGTVVAIGADDTNLVHQGQPLVKLDATDQSIALEQARAELAESVRQARQLFESVDRLRAEVRLREADAAKTQQDLARRQGLAASRAVSAEDLQHAQIAYRTAQAALAAARHQLAAAAAMTEGTSVAQHPMVRRAAAHLRQAYVAWLRLVVPAPVTGYVAKRSVQIGQRVSPGTPLMAVVPLDQLWVEANFKENQLVRLRIGQPVTLRSDLYAGAVTFHGKVMGLAPGTGSAFALLPPQNASGNWIKIVQRVPVRIALDPGELRSHPLRIGLSMAVTVDTHDQGGAVLANSAANDTRYATSTYSVPLTAVDQMIRGIIRSNSGQAPSARAAGR